VDVRERHAALQKLYSDLWDDMQDLARVPPVLEVVLLLYQAVEDVMKAVGTLESRLEDARDQYAQARADARNEWFALHRDFKTWAPRYAEAMWLRDRTEVHLEPIEYSDLDN
jgi:hypothetical protein